MKTLDPVLIIGFGSIGKKHASTLQALGCEVHAYDSDPAAIKDATIRKIERLDTETLKKYRVAFICNPTHMHVRTALLCARAGLHLFIEKPLSNTNAGVADLISVTKRQRLVTMVGCNLRFDPAVRKIKQLLDAGDIGIAYAMHFEYGRYLPYQRPGVDHKKIYAAQKKMGGGVILDDIHEFDLLFWFNDFKTVKKSYFLYDRIGDLGIDVEDISVAVFQFKNKVIGTVRSDYLQQYKGRSIKVVGEKGNLVWSFRDGDVWKEYFENGAEKRKKIFSAAPSGETMFKDELRYFLDCVMRLQPTFNSVGDAARLLRVLLQR